MDELNLIWNDAADLGPSVTPRYAEWLTDALESII